MTQEQETQLWTPISVVDIVMYNPQHGAVNGKQVSYRLFDGTVSHVDIPVSEYNAQTVQDRIHNAAVQHAQIMALKGPTTSGNYHQQLPPVENLVP